MPVLASEVIRNELTFDNPAYVQARKNGRWISKDMPKHLFYYDLKNGSLIVPRGYMSRVMKLIKNKEYEIIDFTVAPKIDIKFKGTLRDYQKEACATVAKNRYGVLKAATGAGKTVMGTFMTATHGVKTLVLVHNKELLNQWKKAFKDFTTIEKIGVIGDSELDIQDVTIGIINSVSNKASELKDEFGFVIYDECHRTVGNSWVTTINTLRPKYHLGLSATPYRSDGLTKVIFRIVGPLLHEVSRTYLEDTGAILVPKIIRVDTDFRYKYKNDYPQLLSNVTKNHARNILIGDKIIEDFRKYKEPCMVVSDRIAHCEELFELINGKGGIKAVILSGKKSNRERKHGLERMKSGECNTLISTVPLLGEGFDLDILNSIHLCTPIKFSGRLLQTIGRILRPSDSGHDARVYDYRDFFVEVLRFSGYSRDKSYKAHGWR